MRAAAASRSIERRALFPRRLTRAARSRCVALSHPARRSCLINFYDKTGGYGTFRQAQACTGDTRLAVEFSSASRIRVRIPRRTDPTHPAPPIFPPQTVGHRGPVAAHSKGNASSSVAAGPAEAPTGGMAAAAAAMTRSAPPSWAGSAQATRLAIAANAANSVATTRGLAQGR